MSTQPKNEWREEHRANKQAWGLFAKILEAALATPHDSAVSRPTRNAENDDGA